MGSSCETDALEAQPADRVGLGLADLPLDEDERVLLADPGLDPAELFLRKVQDLLEAEDLGVGGVRVFGIGAVQRDGGNGEAPGDDFAAAVEDLAPLGDDLFFRLVLLDGDQAEPGVLDDLELDEPEREPEKPEKEEQGQEDGPLAGPFFPGISEIAHFASGAVSPS